MCDSQEDKRAKQLATEVDTAKAKKTAQLRWDMTPFGLDALKGVRQSPADKMIRGRDLINK